MGIPEGYWKAEFDRKETIRRCRVLAETLYQQHNVLSHKRVAWDLREFLVKRHAGDEVLLSVIEFEAGIACYLSCRKPAITHALAVLFRLAQAFEAHPEYRQEWRP